MQSKVGVLKDVLEDFLSNRKLRVQIRGQYSIPAAVLIGAPQGSVLGPLLFILVHTGRVDLAELTPAELTRADLTHGRLDPDCE